MSWGYKNITVESHPRKRSNGCVLEHILVAESMLGRYLEPLEVVHHIDEDRQHNIPSNLMVFKTQKDHAIYHSGKYIDLVHNDDGSYECHTEERYCVCGNILTNRQTKYCSNSCSSKYQDKQHKTEHPTAEELNTLLIELNFSKVGNMFGVSDNTIRKWCKGYGMSTKAKDYR